MELKENRWKGNDFKYPKEVQYIYDNIFGRILDLVKKVETKRFNQATLPAFELGLMGNIDNCLIKLEEKE